MERNNKPQKLDALIPQTLTDTSTDKLSAVHRRIVTAKQSDSGVCNESDFKKVVATIVIGCGIKTLPDTLLQSLLYSTYIENYSARVNEQEFRLAFTLNMTGQLDSKIEHYQLFSVDRDWETMIVAGYRVVF